MDQSDKSNNPSAVHGEEAATVRLGAWTILLTVVPANYGRPPTIYMYRQKSGTPTQFVTNVHRGSIEPLVTALRAAGERLEALRSAEQPMHAPGVPHGRTAPSPESHS